MSSTISQTERATLSTTAVAPLRMDEKQTKLIRTSSIEKIKRFNTFICSQQYYILPAILSWLKSSQSGLQSSTERTIFFFRSLFFKSMLYKYFIVGLKSSGLWIPGEIHNNVVNIKSGKTSLRDILSKCLQSDLLLVATVYGACAIILVQFMTTIYLLYFTLVPYGFLFLVGCMLTIKYICYKTLFFYLSKSAKCKVK